MELALAVDSPLDEVDGTEVSCARSWRNELISTYELMILLFELLVLSN